MAPLAHTPTVLIVDDGRVNRAFIRRCLSGHGYRFVEAENGQEALAVLRQQRVDLIILDLMMPVLDGFEVLKALKARPAWRDIPVIVHSSREDTAAIERALAMGCYDYFRKSLPPAEAKVLLPLKARNAIHAKRLLDDANAQKRLLERELQTAGKYQRFLLPKGFSGRGLDITPWYHPHLGVGGDFFDFVPLADERTAFIIADVSGHGVLAAMVAALLKPLFAQYIRDTASPLHTLRRLNHDLTALTVEGDFVTAFVGIYDPLRQVLQYANAGHPPPLLWRQSTACIECLATTGPVLGLLDDEDWQAEAQEVPVAVGDRLLLVTDGVTEARSATQRTALGISGLQQLFAEAIQASAHPLVPWLWQRLQAYAGGRFHDDVAFVAIDFVPPVWCRTLRLDNDPASVPEAVDTVVAALDGYASPAERQAIRLSLREMLMNAIEHGNLAIGYARKREALAAGTFDELVEHRRRQPPYATRKVTLTYRISPSQAVFTVRDEGNGFDWKALLGKSTPPVPETPHGRGILIAQALMDACHYNNKGNAVTLIKALTPSAAGQVPGSPMIPDNAPTSKGEEPPMQATSTIKGNAVVIALSGPA
ncbi:MAG: hypothetical protein KatS3mg131_1253 [Candidatus Tectimicrobiota bacterium]|nr:MAG: hypothetical protein KatS3mg131_1253 [Candidatus Tectomicrobia bacterium]